MIRCPKSVHNPMLCMFANAHYCVRKGNGTQQKHVDTDIATLNHYKLCHPWRDINWCLNYFINSTIDNSTLKYAQPLIDSIVTTLSKIHK